MIQVTLHDSSIWAAGHSGSGPKGQDTVCAAVSILMEATAAALKASGTLTLAVRGDGFFAVSAADRSGIWTVAQQGFLLLARHCGEFVQVTDLRTRRKRHV